MSGAKDEPQFEQVTGSIGRCVDCRKLVKSHMMQYHRCRSFFRVIDKRLQKQKERESRRPLT